MLVCHGHSICHKMSQHHICWDIFVMLGHWAYDRFEWSERYISLHTAPIYKSRRHKTLVYGQLSDSVMLGHFRDTGTLGL